MANNTITINFVPCQPAPLNGYRVNYRPIGSSGGFRVWPVNFLTSPAVFTDTNDPEGTGYEGFIRGDCGDGKLGVHVNWSAPNDESPSESGGGSASGGGGGNLDCPLHIQVVTESLGFNATSCENIKYSLRLVDNSNIAVVNTGPPISVSCHADYITGDCASPSGGFTAPGPLVIPTGSSVSSAFFAATAPDNIVSSFALDGSVDPDTLEDCEILLP